MKNVKILIISIALSIVVSQTATAQLVADDHLAAYVSIPNLRPLLTEKEASVLVIANPNVKLVKKLAQLFPNAIGQQWWVFNNHYHVSFMNKGQKSRAVFTKEGKFNYAITDCRLEQLPTLLQDQIKNDYAGYTLVHAIEISAHNSTSHQVVLEHAAGYITLKATLLDVEQVDTKKKGK